MTISKPIRHPLGLALAALAGIGAASASPASRASPPAEAQPFTVRGVGLSTYSKGGYAGDAIGLLIERARARGANYVEFSNIVLADLKTGAITDVRENGVEQTAPLGDIARAVDLAHAAGLKVLLKPQIAVRDPAYSQYNRASWINMIDPRLEVAAPDVFFANYRTHLLAWAQLAEAHHVEMLSVGNEMVAVTKPQFTGYWEALIGAVRGVYHGQLTYAALAPLKTRGGVNEIAQIGFWRKLDVAGFDVYPSLASKPAPTVPELMRGWRNQTVYGYRQDYVAFLGRMAEQAGRPVIFTETGVPSFSGASDRVATSDGNIDDGVHKADQQEQADWWEAFFRTWAVDPPAWWRGLIVNNNDPGEAGSYYRANYNINGKLAEKVVARWYGRASSLAAKPDGSVATAAGDGAGS